ncbi:MAG: Rpn family recombination-promoting nuclease/putative transposase [Bacteroidaceae bacterium]|nr:Rpn family recombination-promoting nuclease/putative transposase [Bacteroidaceae bacterium]
MKKEKSKVSAQGAAVINPNDEDIRFIDLRVDVAFKRVFATPGNEELLKMLIDSILPNLHVRTLVLGNQENMGDNRDDKKTVFDIKATTEDGETVVIEMQLAEKKDFNDRLVYYSTYPIREQVRSGDKKYSLAPLYIIAIMDFSMDGDRTTDNVINSFCIRNDNDISRTLTDNVHYVTVELPKFKKSMSDLKTLSDRVIWLLRNMGSLKSVPENFKDKRLEKLFDISNFTAMTYEEQMDYLAKFHAELDRAAELEAAIDKGLKRGMEEGKLETATKLKAAGVSLDIISQCTGVPMDILKNL